MRKAQVQGIVFKRESDKFFYLVLKRNPEKGGYWQPITGGINEDEAPRDAISREVSEELNIEAPKKIVDIDYSFSFTLASGKSLTEYVFGIEITPDQEFNLSKEHTESKWLLYQQASEILEWDTNKKALRHLNEYLIKEDNTKNA